jgi:hypothetical protein
MYNGCLRDGVFPKRRKRTKLIPIIKPGKEDSYEVSKYRPISLLNVGGKVLEEVMISRINHHVYTNDYINKNQYGFTPQLSTTDAAMAVQDSAEDEFSSGEVATLVSLDVEGAFSFAWWPNILKSLKVSGCPPELIQPNKELFQSKTSDLAN